MNKLSIRDMVYWVHPFPRPAIREDWTARPKLLVTEYRTKRAGQVPGEIVKVKGQMVERGRVWYITERGDYVYGALAADPNGGYCYVVFPLGRDMFGFGSIQNRNNAEHKATVSVDYVS